MVSLQGKLKLDYMIKEGYKRGYYRRIPIYARESTAFGVELEGRNWFYGLLVDFMLFVDTEILMVEGFDIWIEEDNN